MDNEKTAPENESVQEEKNTPVEPAKEEKKTGDADEKERPSKREKPAPAPAPAPVVQYVREPRERLSLVGWIACFWPLGVVPPLGVWLWLKYVITAKEGFLVYVPGLAATLVAFLLNSLFTIWFYREDKKLAERHRRRIPEFYLHFWELICGWPGALYAQRKYHHKWRKLSYMLVFWFYVALNLAILFCVIFPATARSLGDGLIHMIRNSSGGKA